jgi:hypothetical protein
MFGSNGPGRFGPAGLTGPLGPKGFTTIQGEGVHDFLFDPGWGSIGRQSLTLTGFIDGSTMQCYVV